MLNKQLLSLAFLRGKDGEHSMVTDCRYLLQNDDILSQEELI